MRLLKKIMHELFRLIKKLEGGKKYDYQKIEELKKQTILKSYYHNYKQF